MRPTIKNNAIIYKLCRKLFTIKTNTTQYCTIDHLPNSGETRIYTSDRNVGSLCMNITHLILGCVLGVFEYTKNLSGQLNTWTAKFMTEMIQILQNETDKNPVPKRNKILESIPNLRTSPIARVRCRCCSSLDTSKDNSSTSVSDTTPWRDCEKPRRTVKNRSPAKSAW